MPKGVEHSTFYTCRVFTKVCWISDAERRWAHFHTCHDLLIRCVESLMPKGVEHEDLSKLNNHLFPCWISDAERRWAQREVLKSFLVSFPCWISDAERRWAQCQGYIARDIERVLNLWCRKALSTIHRDRLYSCYQKCWISDAERRWALQKPLAAPLASYVLNLWCRKALSTMTI